MYYLALDIGGSSIKYGVCEEEGTFIRKGKVPSPGNLKDFMESIGNLYRSVNTRNKIAGLAVSVPGFVDSKNGVIHGVSALPYIHEIPFVPLLSESVDQIPIVIENDGNCGALGEFWKGLGEGKKNVVSVVVGSGIGGGYVCRGMVLETPHHSASEFGFMPISWWQGNLCSWSEFSVSNTADKYSRLIGQRTTAAEMFEREEEDSIAAGLIELFYKNLAAGCLSVAFALDPDIVAVGGAISQRGDFEQRLHGALEQLRGQMPLLDSCNAVICGSKLGNDANLHGAFYNYKKKIGEAYVSFS